LGAATFLARGAFTAGAATEGAATEGVEEGAETFLAALTILGSYTLYSEVFLSNLTQIYLFVLKLQNATSFFLRCF
jgi:hypothetical protein